MKGKLVLAGTGIQVAGQVSVVALAHITNAQKLLFLANDALVATWLEQNNATAESLGRFYQVGKLRERTYAEIIEHILAFVRAGKYVCVAIYGHPGVFSHAGHESVRLARLEGFEAQMVPGISADNCLFADLGIDPGDHGCQSFEAMDFLIHERKADVTSTLLLWQVGAIGNLGAVTETNGRALAVLVETLSELYGADHTVVIYEASRHAIIAPTIVSTKLADLTPDKVSAMCTLYVPPLRAPVANLEVMRKLAIVV